MVEYSWHLLQELFCRLAHLELYLLKNLNGLRPFKLIVMKERMLELLDAVTGFNLDACDLDEMSEYYNNVAELKSLIMDLDIE